MQGMLLVCMVNNSAVISYKCGHFLAIVNFCKASWIRLGSILVKSLASIRMVS